jgi:hypothetical protein
MLGEASVDTIVKALSLSVSLFYSQRQDRDSGSDTFVLSSLLVWWRRRWRRPQLFNGRRTRIVRETAIVYGEDSWVLFLIYSNEEYITKELSDAWCGSPKPPNNDTDDGQVL